MIVRLSKNLRATASVLLDKINIGTEHLPRLDASTRVDHHNHARVNNSVLYISKHLVTLGVSYYLVNIGGLETEHRLIASGHAELPQQIKARSTPQFTENLLARLQLHELDDHPVPCYADLHTYGYSTHTSVFSSTTICSLQDLILLFLRNESRINDKVFYFCYSGFSQPSHISAAEFATISERCKDDCRSCSDNQQMTLGAQTIKPKAAQRLIQFEDKEDAIDVNKELTQPPRSAVSGVRPNSSLAYP
ncbi:hypothetical protein TSAR_010196 [Trichomalopsis sarcophagae]|uniref:Uncharacterized protein n=1 Tax=Trichomalopsis sarcophagae TaxID=543379 RepID=A0A232EX06_9HYME|nr:hypothetical protein TSAR_010196 [Trichomalopsis sarcophagae]